MSDVCDGSDMNDTLQGGCEVLSHIQRPISDSIGTGGTRFRKLNVPVKAIEKLRKNQGIPELEASDADLDDDLGD